MANTLGTHENFKKMHVVEMHSERSFGLVFFAFLSLLALAPALHHKPMRPAFLAVGLVFAAVAWLKPVWLRPLNILWFKLGQTLQVISSFVVLLILFFVVFTPVALILRVLGKDSMSREWQSDSESYWIARDENREWVDFRFQF